MGKTWNHRIATKPQEYWANRCSVSKCEAPVEYIYSYWYVTGRKGRTTDRRGQYCKEHGEKFAKKHGIQIENWTTCPKCGEPYEWSTVMSGHTGWEFLSCINCSIAPPVPFTRNPKADLPMMEDQVTIGG